MLKASSNVYPEAATNVIAPAGGHLFENDRHTRLARERIQHLINRRVIEVEVQFARLGLNSGLHLPGVAGELGAGRTPGARPPRGRTRPPASPHCSGDCWARIDNGSPATTTRSYTSVLFFSAGI